MMFHFCLAVLTLYIVHCKDLIFSLPSFQKKKNILFMKSTYCVCVRGEVCHPQGSEFDPWSDLCSVFLAVILNFGDFTVSFE